MQTFPCAHRVVCRRCFVKTIQVAVSQRLLPLRCVVCRTKILKLKQTTSGGIDTGSVLRFRQSNVVLSSAFDATPQRSSAVIDCKPNTIQNDESQIGAKIYRTSSNDRVSCKLAQHVPVSPPLKCNVFFEVSLFTLFASKWSTFTSETTKMRSSRQFDCASLCLTVTLSLLSALEGAKQAEYANCFVFKCKRRVKRKERDTSSLE
jgi:hypothetical protein